MARNTRAPGRSEGNGQSTSRRDGDLGLRSINPAVHCRTAHEYVCRVLRQGILSGQLAGGTRLVQAEIAAELEVSTTPVREALRDLATEGIIHLDAHRGAVVREVDLAEVREVYELRMLLEPFAVRQAVTNVSAAGLKELESLCEQMDTVDDPAEWTRLNREFHTRLVEAAERPRLASMLSQLTDTAAGYVALAVRSDPRLQQTGGEEHAVLLDAIKRADPEEASTITVQHLRSTLEVLEDLGGEREPAVQASG